MKWASDSSTREEQMGSIAVYLAIVVVCATFALGLNAWDTSSGGLDDQEHPRPIPAGVTQLNPYTYIVQKEANGVLLGSICWGDLRQGGTNRETLPKYLKGDRFIECDRGQKWDVHKSPPPSFLNAAKGTLTTPGWYAPVIFLVGLATLYMLLLSLGSGFAYMGTQRAERKKSKTKKAAAAEALKANISSLEQQRAELIRAYSLPDEDPNSIDQLVFEQAMDKLYKLGLPPAKK